MYLSNMLFSLAKQIRKSDRFTEIKWWLFSDMHFFCHWLSHFRTTSACYLSLCEQSTGLHFKSEREERNILVPSLLGFTFCFCFVLFYFCVSGISHFISVDGEITSRAVVMKFIWCEIRHWKHNLLVLCSSCHYWTLQISYDSHKKWCKLKAKQFILRYL